VGHIASVAVNSRFRGRGVAKQLMKELQRGFKERHDIDTVNLYCRVRHTYTHIHITTYYKCIHTLTHTHTHTEIIY
jgi:predicted acetyltransferase